MKKSPYPTPPFGVIGSLKKVSEGEKGRVDFVLGKRVAPSMKLKGFCEPGPGRVHSGRWEI